MRKHLYFNSSNLDYISDLHEDVDFEPVFQYPQHEYAQSNQYEYGRIKTPSLYIHLLMGNIINKDCPWCGCGVSLTPLNKMDYSDIFQKLKFCMKCPNCGSQGPVLNVCPDFLIKEEDNQHLRSMIESIYIQRKAWDDNELFKKEINK